MLICSSPVPNSRAFIPSSPISSTGVSSVNPYFFPIAPKYWAAMPLSSLALKPIRFIAPSRSVTRSSGKIASRLIRIRIPRPLQPGHAPYGLLKENIRGVSSSMETPQSGQA